MVYREIHESIFELPADYYLVNCISADFSMRKRMNAEFNRRYNIKKTLQKKHPEYAKQYFFDKRRGDCILEGRIFNLVTRGKSSDQERYSGIVCALNMCKDICVKNNIKKLAMSQLGYGSKEVEWERMREMIMETFKHLDVGIVICMKRIE